MTNGVAAWAERDLGAMTGLGNDRPRGGAELKTELDPGLAVVRYLYDNSRVDGRWSVLEPRGFSWWSDGQAQRVWSEPRLDDEGIEVYRLFVETDLLRGVSEVATAVDAIDDMNGLTAGSALVFDPNDGTIRSVASMWVHEQTLQGVASSLSVIGAVQVALAARQATMLAPLVGGELAVSAHPQSGPRPSPDEMLGVLALVRMDGQAQSQWAGEHMTSTLEQAERMPIVVLATGDSNGVTMEVPFGEATALIQLDAEWQHPDLGVGMLARLLLPGDDAGDAAWAARLNRGELQALTRAHFNGAWIGSTSFPTFHAFYPNMLARTGMGAINVALSLIGRARWMDENGHLRDGEEGR